MPSTFGRQSPPLQQLMFASPASPTASSLSPGHLVARQGPSPSVSHLSPLSAAPPSSISDPLSPGIDTHQRGGGPRFVLPGVQTLPTANGLNGNSRGQTAVSDSTLIYSPGPHVGHQNKEAVAAPLAATGHSAAPEAPPHAMEIDQLPGMNMTARQQPLRSISSPRITNSHDTVTEAADSPFDESEDKENSSAAIGSRNRTVNSTTNADTGNKDLRRASSTISAALGISVGAAADIAHRTPTAINPTLPVESAEDVASRILFSRMFERRVPSSTLGSLYPGARFFGEQKSANYCHEVSVVIKDVNMDASTLCGYLSIRGLTEEYPVLTTFFEAEIISERNSLLTGKWDADREVDQQHWSKFPAFGEYETYLNSQDGFIPSFSQRKHIFMRWKEHFLVPDHRVRSINGASFTGFYYMCYDVTTHNFSGFYYYKNSEWFQQLSLVHDPDRSFGSFEFR